MIMDVQQHTEDGTTYRVGQDVRRVDFENDGTPAYAGVLDRIEVEDDEATYWVTWENTTAPDPHGTYAFAPLAVESKPRHSVRFGWVAVNLDKEDCDCVWGDHEDDVPAAFVIPCECCDEPTPICAECLAHEEQA